MCAESSVLCNAHMIMISFTLTATTDQLLGGGGLAGTKCNDLHCGFPGTGEYSNLRCRTVRDCSCCSSKSD